MEGEVVTEYREDQGVQTSEDGGGEENTVEGYGR